MALDHDTWSVGYSGTPEIRRSIHPGLIIADHCGLFDPGSTLCATFPFVVSRLA
jgi:hypothetical protein